MPSLDPLFRLSPLAAVVLQNMHARPVAHHQARASHLRSGQCLDRLLSLHQTHIPGEGWAEWIFLSLPVPHRHFIIGGNKSAALGGGGRPGAAPDGPHSSGGGVAGFDPLLGEGGAPFAQPPRPQGEEQAPAQQGLSQVGLLCLILIPHMPFRQQTHHTCRSCRPIRAASMLVGIHMQCAAHPEPQSHQCFMHGCADDVWLHTKRLSFYGCNHGSCKLHCHYSLLWF